MLDTYKGILKLEFLVSHMYLFSTFQFTYLFACTESAIPSTNLGQESGLSPMMITLIIAVVVLVISVVVVITVFCTALCKKKMATRSRRKNE